MSHPLSAFEAHLTLRFGAGFFSFGLDVMFVQEIGVIYAVEAWFKSQNCKQQCFQAAARGVSPAPGCCDCHVESG